MKYINDISGISNKNINTHNFVNNECIKCFMKLRESFIVYTMQPERIVGLVAEDDLSCNEFIIKRIIK